MKQLQIADQVRLGPGRCLSLTVSGMMYRLFRSLITVAILTLAVTFLSHILSYSLIEHETRLSAYRRLTDSRQLGQWITRLSSAQTLETIEQNLLAGDAATLARYEQQTPQQSVAELHDALQRVRRFGEYLDQLPLATRIVLVGSQSIWAVLQEMGRPGHLAQFERTLADLHLPPMTLNSREFQQLVSEDLPRIEASAERIRQDQQQALDQLHQQMGSRSVVQWLAEVANSPQGRALLHAAGFTLSEERLAKLSVSAWRQEHLEQWTAAIQVPAVSRAIARRADIAPSKQTLETVANWLTDMERADWLSERLDQAQVRGQMTGKQLLALAHSVQMERRWTAAVGITQPQPRNGLFDLPRRTQWLIVLSFLVCAAGVTNAMFMSVTERFAEIATMKCLGALDGFLMQMFLMESVLQGAVGGALGIALGMGMAIGRGWISFGSLALAAMPWTDLFWCAVLSLLAGVMLAVFAAVGPAWMAARLAPMEAMRID